MRRSIIWIFTILLISFSLMFFFCSSEEPSLSSEDMEWRIYAKRQPDVSDPNYPIEVIEDGFKMIRLFKKNESYFVEWGWKYIVKNNSDKVQDVSVTYILKDADKFEITSDYASEYVKPGETGAIQSTSIISHDNIKRISYSGWAIDVYPYRFEKK